MTTQSIATLLSYSLAAVTVFFALAMVTTRRIFRAAIYLMMVLAVSAGIYLLMGAEFLAGVQLLVYVGGIVVLLVFAVLLTSTLDSLEEAPSWPRRVTGFVAAAAVFALSAGALTATPFNLSPGSPPGNDTAALGTALLDYGAAGYVLPFEVVSLLLLAAAIGGIVIARRAPEDTTRGQS